MSRAIVVHPEQGMTIDISNLLPLSIKFTHNLFENHKCHPHYWSKITK